MKNKKSKRNINENNFFENQKPFRQSMPDAFFKNN